MHTFENYYTDQTVSSSSLRTAAMASLNDSSSFTPEKICNREKRKWKKTESKAYLIHL